MLGKKQTIIKSFLLITAQELCENMQEKQNRKF